MSGSKQPGTDDSRVSDGADKRREELAGQAAKGLRTALRDQVSSPDAQSATDKLKKSPSSEALGSSAEEAVEDGEGAGKQ
ncbi:hypothetical protein [Rhizobium sp. 2MFCol3.1]|uniref:hypothetical protein n=1 Tax=Rhizobium sp. 2MFCol3.1 TaxID=1246459 RepID=UPI0012DCA4AD|nr:hypothetical protein [Rhizobium sp. 2MFCol3.1]